MVRSNCLRDFLSFSLSHISRMKKRKKRTEKKKERIWTTFSGTRLKYNNNTRRPTTHKHAFKIMKISTRELRILFLLIFLFCFVSIFHIKIFFFFCRFVFFDSSRSLCSPWSLPCLVICYQMNLSWIESWNNCKHFVSRWFCLCCV